jgi:hypothetical protein
MRRLELFEIHDHPLFPAALRNLVTDALQILWKFGDSYHSIAPRLHRFLVASSSHQVLDLCSGGGGPWLNLAGRLARDHSFPVQVSLSDKYPNLDAFEKIAHQPSLVICGVHEPVDATKVPEGLDGFRTMFSSFHHFDPPAALEVLRSAQQARQGIGIFEVPRRSLKTILLLCLTPLLVLLLTPVIAPFRWSRLLWTYLFPIVPLVIFIDGLISCLRAYSLEELREMVTKLEQQQPHAEYHWEVGEEYGGLLPVTYLIGCPMRPSITIDPELKQNILQHVRSASHVDLVQSELGVITNPAILEGSRGSLYSSW